MLGIPNLVYVLLAYFHYFTKLIYHTTSQLMTHAFELKLTGTAADLADLFSYSGDVTSDTTALESYVAHAFNQTLVRDRIYGGWAQVLSKDGGFVLKMSAPHHDLSTYQQRINNWLTAGSSGLSLFRANESLIPPDRKTDMRFLLPFGLAMRATRSVQLLHFPPLETFVFHDYLYSPTNRRWENLLGYNGVNGVNYAELETIVDCVPIAAPGDDSKGIFPFNNLFTDYVKQMLKARLAPTGGYTQPVVAYGAPVMTWLEQNFPDTVKSKLEPLSLIELKLYDSEVITPVLCANHPSKYLYYTDQPFTEEKNTILLQDLIAAGWQGRMAYSSAQSAAETLESVTNHWKNFAHLTTIMEQEDQAYGYTV